MAKKVVLKLKLVRKLIKVQGKNKVKITKIQGKKNKSGENKFEEKRLKAWEFFILPRLGTFYIFWTLYS